MSTGSVVSAIITFVLVLGLMGLALRLLRKYTMGSAPKHSAIPMEVVQRLSLGQRQGIAVVRVGARTMLVSMGEGGVRFLTELDAPLAVQGDETAPPKMPTSRKKYLTQQSNRVSYVAPIEDFRAVLSMAMSESVRP